MVRLVVLNYNGGELTLRCLEHLSRLAWPREALQVVCVDNASTDGSAERIASEHPWVDLRRNERNVGFPGNNTALVDLDGVDYVGLVNNDAFAEPGYLTPLVDTLEADPSLGAACPKLVLAPRFAELTMTAPTFVPGAMDPRELGVMVRSIHVGAEDVGRDAHLATGGWGQEHDRGGSFEWTSGEALVRVPVAEGCADHEVRLELQAEAVKEIEISSGTHTLRVVVGPRPVSVTVPLAERRVDVVNNVGSIVYADGAGADRGWLEPDDGRFDVPADVFAWCGGGVLMRPEYLADVGLFDERFFLYYEDTDLAWRGRARGWGHRTAPAAVLRHVHAASSTAGSDVFAFHVERNRLLMLAKNAPMPLARREAWRFVLVTASYARRDVVAPMLRGRRPNLRTVRRRTSSYASFLALLPAMLAERRRLRHRQLLPDERLVAWLVAR